MPDAAEMDSHRRAGGAGSVRTRCSGAGKHAGCTKTCFRCASQALRWKAQVWRRYKMVRKVQQGKKGPTSGPSNRARSIGM